MAWQLAKKPEYVRATQKLAKQHFELPVHKHDRPEKASIIKMLNDALDTGQFRTCLWAKAHCKADGVTYRVNGRHTSSVLSERNGKIEWPWVQIEEYDCDTLEDVADLFATFDPSQSARGANDLNRVYLASAKELAEVAPRSYTLAVTAIAYAQWEDLYADSKIHSARERAVLPLEHPGFVIWLDSLFINVDARKILRRGGVAAAMFRTWQKSHKDANEFWVAVRDATGNPPSVPDRKLNKFLAYTTSKEGGNATPGKEKVSQREYYIRSLRAWNAWRRGEATDLKYSYGCPTPPVV